jgi:quercetin dioxygenase-like cupin family protein
LVGFLGVLAVIGSGLIGIHPAAGTTAESADLSVTKTGPTTVFPGETSVAYLVVEEDQVPYVVRRNERPRLQVGGNTSKVEVLSAQPKRNLELLMAELPPGMPAGDKRHYHHGEECLVVLEGRVRLTCGEHVLVLETGDSCHYDGRVPHAIENCGSTMARVMISITPAAFEPIMRARDGVASTRVEAEVVG